MGTHRQPAAWSRARESLRLYATGVPATTRAVPAAEVLALPLWGLLFGLVAAGLLLIVRELALHTMSRETIANLHHAVVLGAFAGGATVVLAIARLTRGWRLRAVTTALGARGTTACWAPVLLMAVRAGLLGWLVLRGHGTLAVVTSEVGGQVGGLCMLWRLKPDSVPGWRPPPPTIPLWQLLIVTVCLMLVPLVVLILDDDPRRRMLPFALGALPVALVTGLALAGLPVRRPPSDWRALGSAVELAGLACLVVLLLGS